MASGKKIQVYLADKIHDDGVKLLSAHFNLQKLYGFTNDALLKFISGRKSNKMSSEILVVRSTRKIDEKTIKFLKGFTSVRTICTVSSGFDNVDVNSARKYGIRILNVPNGNYVSAAEHTIAMLLAISKKLVEKHKEIEKGVFNTLSGQTTELNGKTIGIIGVGRVGSYVAKLARVFSMNIFGNDIKQTLKNKYRWIKFMQLNSLLKKSDFITVHTPLDSTTLNLLNRDNLKLIKKDSVILNCARGGIINEHDLFAALKTGRISYAGIDVFKNEPNINFRFSKLKNVILSPHLAGKTKESYKRMALQAATRLIKLYN